MRFFPKFDVFVATELPGAEVKRQSFWKKIIPPWSWYPSATFHKLSTDALVSFTVLQSFIRLVSMMNLWSLLVDLYGTRALEVSMLCPAFLLCYFYFYCYQSYIPFMISSKFTLNIISRSLKKYFNSSYLF